MTTHRPGTLDTFEAALLAELRTVVAERETHRPPAARRRRSRRLVLVPLGVAAAVATAIAVLPGTGPEPAYAVTVDGDGAVHVRVHDLEDAEGLEEALAAQGVAADVLYLPDDTQCADGRYTQAPNSQGGFRMTMGAGYGYGIDMDAGVVRDGETLVITASALTTVGDAGSGSLVSVGVATGEVGACQQVPATPPPGGEGLGTRTDDQGQSSREG